MNAERRFLLSQGFTEPPPESCDLHFAALQFQPRVIGVVLVAGMILQSVARLPSIALFVMLGIVLCRGAVWPDANLFEWAYNLTSPLYRLTRAPAPRRFAQGLAGGMALAIAACLYMRWMLSAMRCRAPVVGGGRRYPLREVLLRLLALPQHLRTAVTCDAELTGRASRERGQET